MNIFTLFKVALVKYILVLVLALFAVLPSKADTVPIASTPYEKVILHFIYPTGDSAYVFSDTVYVEGSKKNEFISLVRDWVRKDTCRILYEYGNHLGNVLTVVSDRKIPVDNNSDNVVDYYVADVMQSTDYGAFGNKLAGRNFVSSTKYPMSFNGKRDDEETGTQDYGMRIYNPSLGKFLSVDPLSSSYPELTPYQFASNSPIEAIDLDGLEMFSNKFMISFGLTTAITPTTTKILSDAVERQKAEGGSIKKNLVIAGAKHVGMVYGATAAGIAVAYGGYVAAPYFAGGAIWAGGNMPLIIEGTALVSGFLYDGPEDLFAGSKSDELARAFKGTGTKVLNYFSGPAGKYKNAFNISLDATSGFKGKIEDFTRYLTRKNLLGTVDKIIADNPYGYADYLDDAAKALKQGGDITIRGTANNEYFKQVIDGTAKGMDNFEVFKTATKVSDEVKKGMKTTSGKDINGDVFEIVLKRK